MFAFIYILAKLLVVEIHGQECCPSCPVFRLFVRLNGENSTTECVDCGENTVCDSYSNIYHMKPHHNAAFGSPIKSVIKGAFS